MVAISGTNTYDRINILSHVFEYLPVVALVPIGVTEVTFLKQAATVITRCLLELAAKNLSIGRICLVLLSFSALCQREKNFKFSRFKMKI